MTKWLSKVRVAACNVSPIFLNTPATVSKTISLIQEAARNKADLVVFPETHIPAFPLWSAVSAPIDTHSFFHKLCSQSLLLSGPELLSLRQTCASSHIFAHIGFNERSPASVGTIYNSSVLISDRGEIVNHHRKLVPTWFEKLTWANGDGAGLRVVDSTRIGRVGGLICGENTNPLASGFMDKEMRDAIVKVTPSAAETLDSLTQGASLFLDPTGAQVGEQVQGEEGIAYADLDLNDCVEPKQFHDVVGGYQRFDVFDLKVNRERLRAESAFGGERRTATQPQWSVNSSPRREEDASTGTDEGLARLKAELDGMKDDALQSAVKAGE
ncbi:hypothetical protein BST61_g10616 [Cercospora zeina]